MNARPIIVIFAFSISAAPAQTIVAPVLSDSSLSTHVAPVTPSPAPLSDITSAFSSGLPLLRLGSVAFRPHAGYRYTHSTGLLRAPGEPLDTNSQSVDLGSALEIGQHWHADYTADWVWYSNERFKDGINQSASVSGAYAYLNWTFGVSGAYTFGYPTLAETGYQTRQETLGTGASAHGTVGQRSFIDLAINQSYRKANAVATDTMWQRSSIRDWSGRAAIGQQITDKFSASAGVTYGYATQGVGPDMTYTRPEFQANWAPTDKITVGAMAGWERRRFHDSNAGTFSSPVYSGTVTYHPLDTTSFTAGVTQGVAASYIGNAVTRSTGWNVGLGQRLFQILYGNVGYSQQRSRYHETVFTLPEERTDKYDTFSASLALRFLQHGSASVFYQRTHNGSNRFGYGFTSTSYGAEVRFSF